MNSGPVAVREPMAESAFEFEPDADGRHATLHFRFTDAGQLWVSDVRITDAETGADVLPAGASRPRRLSRRPGAHGRSPRPTPSGSRPDGALHVTLGRPRGAATGRTSTSTAACSRSRRAARTARVTFRGTPGQMLTPALYNVVGGVLAHRRSARPFLSQVALARDAGVNLVSFAAPDCWAPRRTSREDWAPLDPLPADHRRQPEGAAGAAGRRRRARLVAAARIPRRAWSTTDQVRRRPLPASPTAPTAPTSARTSRSSAGTSSRPFPDHFAGIHPCGQNTGEWFYEDSWERPLSGYDPATRGRLPRVAEGPRRPAGGHRRSRRPRTSAAPTRTASCATRPRSSGSSTSPASSSRRWPTTSLAMAAACRRGTDGQKLVVFFYGYLFEFAPLAERRADQRPLRPLVRCSRAGTSTSSARRSPTPTASGSAPRPCMTRRRERRARRASSGSTRTTRAPSSTRAQQEHVQEGGLVDLRADPAGDAAQHRPGGAPRLRDVVDGPAGPGLVQRRAHLGGDGAPAPGRRRHARTRASPSRRRSRPIVDEDSMCHLAGGSAAFARAADLRRARRARPLAARRTASTCSDDVLGGPVPREAADLPLGLGADAGERQALREQRRDGRAAAREAAALQLRPTAWRANVPVSRWRANVPVSRSEAAFGGAWSAGAALGAGRM